MNDDEKQIDMCLNCERPTCINCVDGNVDGRSGRPGKKIAIIHNGVTTVYATKRAAERALGMSHGNFYAAAKKGKWKDYRIVEA